VLRENQDVNSALNKWIMFAKNMCTVHFDDFYILINVWHEMSLCSWWTCDGGYGNSRTTTTPSLSSVCARLKTANELPSVRLSSWVLLHFRTNHSNHYRHHLFGQT